MDRGSRWSVRSGIRCLRDGVGELDVRDALPSVQCPTLVLHRANDAFVDECHSRYAETHITGARYVAVAARGQAADEIEQFLTGVRRPVLSDRMLATVRFTDIVGSTDRAAELGDSGWRALLERHDALVREKVKRYRGQFVKSLGEGMLATFDGPGRAISSAIAIRDGVRQFAPVCTPANVSSSPMATSAASLFTSVRALVASPARARCWLAAPRRPGPHRRLRSDPRRPRTASAQRWYPRTAAGLRGPDVAPGPLIRRKQERRSEWPLVRTTGTFGGRALRFCVVG